MGKNNSQDKEKEHYRLWWKYLKRSDNYKKVCGIIKKSKIHKLARQINNQADAIVFFSNHRLTLHKEFTKSNKANFFISLLETYGRFGDVHTDSFEKWWNSTKKQMEEREKIPCLYDYIDFIKIDLLDCADVLKSRNELKLIRNLNTDDHSKIIKFLKSLKDKEKEPTLNELVEYFPVYLKKKYTGGSFLIVNVARKSKEELENQFTEFIKKQKQEPNIKKLEWDSKRNYKIFSNTKYRHSSLRVDELKRYLNIYDMRKNGLSMSEIIKTMGKDNKNTDTRSIFHQDLKRARKIIKNVESGTFPGNYQPKTN